MGHDFTALLWEETADLGDLLHTLDTADWDHPSLCDGWRVRDVIGHMCVGHLTPMGQALRALAGYRFNVPKASDELSREYASTHTPAELLANWDELSGNHVRR